MNLCSRSAHGARLFKASFWLDACPAAALLPARRLMASKGDLVPSLKKEKSSLTTWRHLDASVGEVSKSPWRLKGWDVAGRGMAVAAAERRAGPWRAAPRGGAGWPRRGRGPSLLLQACGRAQTSPRPLPLPRLPAVRCARGSCLRLRPCGSPPPQAISMIPATSAQGAEADTPPF